MLKTYRIYYTFPNDVMEYAARVEGQDEQDAEARFMGDMTEQERQEMTITRIVEVPHA